MGLVVTDSQCPFVHLLRRSCDCACQQVVATLTEASRACGSSTAGRRPRQRRCSRLRARCSSARMAAGPRWWARPGAHLRPAGACVRGTAAGLRGGRLISCTQACPPSQSNACPPMTPQSSSYSGSSQCMPPSCVLEQLFLRMSPCLGCREVASLSLVWLHAGRRAGDSGGIRSGQRCDSAGEREQPPRSVRPQRRCATRPGRTPTAARRRRGCCACRAASPASASARTPGCAGFPLPLMWVFAA